VHKSTLVGQDVIEQALKYLGNLPKEVYGMLMPAVDIFEEGNEVVIHVDLPGFAKKDIAIRAVSGTLNIVAERKIDPPLGTVYLQQRPPRIEKRIPLPPSIAAEAADKSVVGAAKYSDGVLTIRIPIPKSNTIPLT
jgi:HSP20 family protein